MAEAENKNVTKVYDITKRKQDDMWAVKAKGSTKVIKLFKTKAEAEAYTTKMAQNQKAAFQVRNSKGANVGRYSASSKTSTKVANAKVAETKPAAKKKK